MGHKTAVISDIHGNSPALREVLADIEREGCEQIFMLGDAINGVDPGGCLNLLWGCADIVCLAGNAELYLLTPGLDVFPRRKEAMYASIIHILDWFRARLSSEQLAWVASWPVEFQWEQIYLVHDSPLDQIEAREMNLGSQDECYRNLIYHGQGVQKKMQADYWDRLAGCLKAARCNTLFCGHTHEPFIYSWDGFMVCNVGSAGQPQDGDPRASWLLVTAEDGKQPGFEIRRVPYAVDEVVAMLEAAQDYEPVEVIEAKKKMLQTGRHWRYFSPQGV